MTLCLNVMSDSKHFSCKAFRNLNFMATRCTNSETKMVKNHFLYHLKKDIKKIGYTIDVLRQTACLVVNPIKVNNFAYLLDCTTVGRASG